jgi:hypothetical protein
MTSKPTPEKFLPLDQVIESCLPYIRKMARGRYAISIGGSIGKGAMDGKSDVDFRLFCDETTIFEPEGEKALNEFRVEMDRWRENGINIDGCWIRTTGEINQALEKWIKGEARPDDIEWTIWGYYLLTDISNQHIIEDPDGVVAGWKQLLSHYPEALKQSVIKRHAGSLKYWRHDYHYRNKVERGDVVFLAGLSARLVHDMIQVLFALNEVYFSGDGWNLRYVAGFKIKPENFDERVNRILYPAGAFYEQQYADICDLIDDVLSLTP